MIRLTKLDGKPVTLIVEHIVAFEKLTHDANETLVYTTETEEPTKVKESYEEVARKALEWKTTFEKYRVGLSLEKPHLWEAAEKKLKVLAGLEEPKNG